jgi:hypothetical protein
MELGRLTQGKQVMFRNFTFNDIERLGEVMLAAVALLLPLVAAGLLLTT